MLTVLGFVLAAVFGWFGPGEVLLDRLGAPRRLGQTLTEPRLLLERNYLGWGLLAIAAEALQGLLPVGLFRLAWPESPWALTVLLPLLILAACRRRPQPLVALWGGWLLADPLVALLSLLLLAGSHLLLRQTRATTLAGLTLLPVLTALLHSSDGLRVAIAALVALVVAWLLPSPGAGAEPVAATPRGMLSLDGYLDPAQVGADWVRLGELRQQGLAVPETWLLLPGHDPELLLAHLTAQPWRLQLYLFSRRSGRTRSGAAVLADRPEDLASGVYGLLQRIQTALATDERWDYGLIAVQPAHPERFSGRAGWDADGPAWIEGLPGDRQRLETTSMPCDRYAWVDEHWLPQEGCRGELPRAVVERVADLLSAVQSNDGTPVRILWTDDGERVWLQGVFVNVKSTD